MKVRRKVLEAGAAPGPLAVSLYRNGIVDEVRLVTPPGLVLVGRADVRSTPMLVATMGPHLAEPTAALIAHWSKKGGKFVDRVKDALLMIEQGTPDHARDELMEAITEIEEVDV